MGAMLGASLGRLMQQGFPNTRVPSYIMAGLVLFGVIGYIVFTERKRKRYMTSGAFQGVTRNGETGMLHLVGSGAKMPSNIVMQLRPFNTAADVFQYVYRQFGEAAFQEIILHRAGATEPAIFRRDDAQTDNENIARLETLMSA